MKKDKKNKGRKSLTAVGAVVAAGLTPGIVTATPTSPQRTTDVEFTAADAVSIGGDVFDFDELFAMQQVVNDQRHRTVYGPRPPKVQKDDTQEAAIRAKMRQDSIRQAMDARAQALVYGPPPVAPSRADELRQIAAENEDGAIGYIQENLRTWIAHNIDIGNTPIDANTDLIQDLNLDPKQMQALSDEIENNYGVQISGDMLKRLNTLDRLAKFIIAVARPLED